MNVWAVFPSPSASDASRRVANEWRQVGCRVAVLLDEPGDINADLVLSGLDYKGWAWAMNRLCHAAVERCADIVVCVGDDLFPRDGWTAQRLASAWASRFGDSTHGVLQCLGDVYGDILNACVSPAIGRDFILRHGPMHEGYRHLFVDTELQAVATKLGVFHQEPSLTIYHDHWSRGLTPDRLPADRRETIRAHCRKDMDLFNARRDAGFPGYLWDSSTTS